MNPVTPFPISKTKINPPQRRADLVTRPRLIEMLYSLLNKKLTLISAPAGYGKTSLLIDLADKSEIPICWLSLDVLDQEPQRFLAYLIACVREQFPAFGVESLTALDNSVSIEKENEKLAVIFSNEMYKIIHEHFAIVLDDYQFVDTVPEIRAFINRLIQLAGEHCHILLASRMLPTLAGLHLLIARDQVGGLSLEDLAFQPEEIQTLFTQNAGKKLSQPEAEELAQKTDGWITSISLTGLRASPGRLQSKAAFARNGPELYDYFAREVLEQQSPGVREFLLITSLFEEVNAELCGAVLKPFLSNQRENWQELFDTVQKDNLFAIAIGAKEPVFRYHHLFQDYLQAKLQEEKPEIIQGVMTRLALFYMQKQDWEKAYHIYYQNGDQQALVSLIEASGTYLIRNGRIATLGNWLDRLPVFLMQKNPRLLSLQGAVAYTRGETQTSITLLKQAEDLLKQNKDTEALAVTLARRAVAYREAGDYIHALSDSEEAIRLSAEDTAPSAQFNLAAAMRVKGIVLHRFGQTLEALAWLEKSLTIFNSLRDKSYIPLLEMELGTLHHALGEVEVAIRFYQSASKAWEKSGHLEWLATVMNNLGVLYHQRGEYEKSFQILEKAIEAAQRGRAARSHILALCSLGDVLVDINEINHASECFDDAFGLASQSGYSYLAFYASVAKARVARLENHFEIAEALTQDLLKQIGPITSPADEALLRLEHGRFLLCTDRPHLAISELLRAVSLYEQDGHVLEMNIARFWLAAAQMAFGQPDQALPQLRALISSYRDMGEPSSMSITTAEVRPWFQNGQLSADILADVERLFSKSEKFKRSLPTLRRRLRQISKSAFISPPHLKITGFGPAQVFVTGRKIAISDWQTRETRDLFFFFLQANSQTKEDLASVFWPDISPARLKMRFKTNIYRLRHAVGQNTILFEDDRYFFNRDIDYEYDVEVFKKLLEQFYASKDTAETGTLLQSAVNLVKGPYLADIDADWAAQERTRIEMQFHAALMRLAEFYLETGQAAPALETCQAALRSDPLLEEAYRLSMRAYAALGDTGAVARVFQTCSQVFNDELGVKPSRETEKLYRKLT